EDDPRPAHRRARRQAEGHAELLLIPSRYPKEPPHRRTPMSKFVIEPHFRLQEWVAEEKGYFKDEGLDYVFQELIQSSAGQPNYRGDKVGASRSFERGGPPNVGCACHWTVDVAASKGKGRLYADVYSVSPAGVFVPPDSPIKKPEDLAGVPIAVGY